MPDATDHPGDLAMITMTVGAMATITMIGTIGAMAVQEAKATKAKPRKTTRKATTIHGNNKAKARTRVPKTIISFQSSRRRSPSI